MGKPRKPEKSPAAPAAEIVKTVAANLNSLMDFHGYANKRLAEATHGVVSEGTIQRMRRADVAVQIDNLAAVARVFGLRAWQLLTDELDPKNPPQLAFPSPAEQDLYRRFREFIASSR